MSSIKKLREENRGSILILTMLALVGAISIAVAMSSISIVERKMTTKSRKSTTAFQSANSGIEWAMEKINDAEREETINDVFDVTPDPNGQIDCPDNLFSDSSGLSCKVTFLKRVAGQRVLIVNDELMENVVAIRSSGTFGTDTEQVGRALEAYAMPNCGNDKRVADFCIDSDDHNPESDSWGAAVATCESAGKRLCTAAELVAANQLNSITIDNLFSADVTGDDEYAVVDEGEVSNVISGVTTSDKFRCCRNR